MTPSACCAASVRHPRSTLITRDYDMSRTLAAAHTLVCALAAAAVRGGMPLPANGSGALNAAEEAQWTPEVAEVVKVRD